MHVKTNSPCIVREALAHDQYDALERKFNLKSKTEKNWLELNNFTQCFFSPHSIYFWWKQFKPLGQRSMYSSVSCFRLTRAVIPSRKLECIYLHKNMLFHPRIFISTRIVKSFLGWIFLVLSPSINWWWPLYLLKLIETFWIRRKKNEKIVYKTKLAVWINWSFRALWSLRIHFWMLLHGYK